MRRTLISTAVLALSVGTAVATAPSAGAVSYTTWTNGVRAYSVPGNTYSFLGDVQRTSCTWRTYATAKYDGDHVYVRDDCVDGIKSAAVVMYSVGGNQYRKYCVNPFGAGTIAHCDMDWPEGSSVQKIFMAGLKDPSPVPGQWQWGNFAPIYE